ncbi:MBG domain-containing protein [Flavihumibacter sp. UBA7668]|uniref:MBG domain-containing protein n=1 Tax=Flavihumibacter sp. UBA7668 TaxID=1946542 RepID=UPI0025C719B8|nr:MBG domain-containing protein [Flavihumibacter sp. UBA7668]
MMKHLLVFITIISALICPAILNAQAPTNPSTNLQFYYIEGNRMSIAFRPAVTGGGERRVVIARKGAAVTSKPVNGQTYVGDDFGKGTAMGNGEFVILNGPGTSTYVNGLEPGTTYHFAVFDYNGYGATSQFLTSSFLAGSQATVGAPAKQASITADNITGTTVKLNIVKGDGDMRLIVMKAGGPVDADPVNFTGYSSSTTFGNGQEIGNGNFVVDRLSNGSFDYTNISGLSMNTTYHVAIYEANGTNAPTFLKPPGRTSFGTVIRPTTASTVEINYTDTKDLTPNIVVKGNGEKKLIIMQAGQEVTAVPVDGKEYIAGADFGTGTAVAPNQFVVYNGNGNNDVRVNNLIPGTRYFVKVFDYNGSGVNTSYLTTSSGKDDAVVLTTPTIQTKTITLSGQQGGNINLNWTKGNGLNRLILAKAGGPVDASPVDFQNYIANAAFGKGDQIGTGNYVVGQVNGSSALVTGLTPGITYHFAVFDYNGIRNPMYLKTTVPVIQYTPDARPSTASSSLRVITTGVDFLKLAVDGGNGSRRILVARKAGDVSGLPVDHKDYNENATFGLGEQVNVGDFVVYDNDQRNFTITGLEANTNYHFRVYEYNKIGTNLYYLTTAFASGIFKTAAYPTEAAKQLTFSNITANSVKASFTRGTGQRVLVVVKQTGIADAQPINYSSYGPNPYFGLGAQVATGNFSVLYDAKNEITVSGLTSGVSYDFTVYETNIPSAGPVYLKPGLKGTVKTIANSQTITFTDIPDKIYGDPAFILSAKASSGLPVTLTSSNNAIVAITGTRATIKGTGTVSITATQPGQGNYGAATPVTITFNVAKAPLQIKADDKRKLLNADNPPLTITYKGFVYGETAAVLQTPPIISTTATKTSPVGNYPISISGAGAKNYTITYIPGTLVIETVVAKKQVINFPPIADKVYGDPAFDPNATASSGLPVSYTISNTAIVKMVSGKLNIVGTGTVTVTASQAGNATWAPADPVSRTFTVRKASLEITAINKTRKQGEENPTLTFNVTGFVYGETSSVLNPKPILSTTAVKSSPAGNYPISITGGEAANYTIKRVPGILTVEPLKQSQSINFTAIAEKTYGDADFAAWATASSGLAVSYSDYNPEVILINNGTIQIVGAGTTTIKASQNGNATYLAAPSVTITLIVKKAVLTIKADNQVKEMKTDNPVLTVSYSGFVKNETATVLTQAPVIKTTAQKESFPGLYPITVSGASAANYTISYLPGTLSVIGTQSKIFCSSLNTLDVHVYSESPKNLTIQVYGISGIKLIEQPVQVAIGLNQYQFNVSSFATGIYVVRLVGNQFRYSEKIRIK